MFDTDDDHEPRLADDSYESATPFRPTPRVSSRVTLPGVAGSEISNRYVTRVSPPPGTPLRKRVAFAGKPKVMR